MTIEIRDGDMAAIMDNPELAVLALIEHCTPEFLGRLKVHGLLRAQKRLRGVEDMSEEVVGKAAVNSVKEVK